MLATLIAKRNFKRIKQTSDKKIELQKRVFFKTANLTGKTVGIVTVYFNYRNVWN
jgi:hypothetical protein